MKKIFNTLIQKWQMFITLERRLHEKVSFWMSLKIMSIALIQVVALLLLPTLLVINLLIFDVILYLLIGLLIIFAYVFIFIYFKRYEKTLVKHVQDILHLNISYIFKVERLLGYIGLSVFLLIVLGALL